MKEIIDEYGGAILLVILGVVFIVIFLKLMFDVLYI